ncbi:AfsA-related hotdog domain-containing protein [Pacificoceanicola onchidii]|uniref:AfsA-related hotdog domain-containing protein n=1 Tax=Pacificoceanicola onchidii TaxID=2562685 RepID=UPI0010A65042|nr:AfsA-related hotdog domain-containing protein [Pacificoceanicola onchidii]
MSALDRRMDLRNAVLQYSPSDRPGVARLIIDQRHPFFFDHPLDHVPGLLLLEGAVQAAQNCATAPCYVSAIRAEFIQYVMFDDPVTVETYSAERNGRQCCKVEVHQADKLRARIEVELTRQIRPLPRRADFHPGDGLQPCEGDLLNKVRAENVLITTPVVGKDSVEARLLPISNRCLFADSTQAVHPLYLLESFMQVQRYLNATADGDHRIRDILTGVSIEQLEPRSDLSGGVFLRGARDFSETGRGRLSRSAWLYAGQKPFAKCSIQTARVKTRAKKDQGEA